MVKCGAEGAELSLPELKVQVMRIIVKFLASLVLILALAWVGLWWYAQGRLEAGLTTWMNQMGANGTVQISYDTLTRGTSPLSAKVELTNVRISVQSGPDAAPVLVTLPSFGMHIDAANPMLLHFDNPSEIGINSARGQMAMTFGSITSFDRLVPKALFDSTVWPIDGGELHASNINFLASSGSLLILHVDDLAAATTTNNTAGPGQAGFSTSETIDGLALSPILSKIASIPFNGRINQLAFNLSLSGPLPDFAVLQETLAALPPGDARRKLAIQTVHDWAAQGGSGNAGLVLAIGPSTLKADGTVKFDANVQPSGTGNVSADHLDAFTAGLVAAYPQIQDSLSNIQARLSPYLSTSAAGGQALNIHAAYGTGGVTLNGQKVSDMQPMNWDLLENPPAPPAQAPGDGSGAAATRQ
jgi:hypothetical protein